MLTTLVVDAFALAQQERDRSECGVLDSPTEPIFLSMEQIAFRFAEDAICDVDRIKILAWGTSKKI